MVEITVRFADGSTRMGYARSDLDALVRISTLPTNVVSTTLRHIDVTAMRQGRDTLDAPRVGIKDRRATY